MDILGVQCVACGTKRRHKNLRYHPQTFSPYCENPYVCTEEHPNSPINLIKSQKQTTLLSYEEAKVLYSTGVVSDLSDRVGRLLNNPLTVRITSVEMAEFLVRQSDLSGQNISELVRSFIQSMMERYDTPTIVEKPKPTITPSKIDDNDLIF
jgi:hypothetical protein